MIHVTKTFLPSQEEYQKILKTSWDKYWITNRGELVKSLEDRLKEFLKVPNVIATTNGTLPIQMALKTLPKTGEVITTPFSYVATTSSIVWEGFTPVFVDIEPDYFTIDPKKIINAITDNTVAILATHVFGNPCDVEAIEKIAKQHNLVVIYDAAHCFGVTYKGTSIFNYGDMSTCSFHATKIFHTGEGGAVFCADNQLLEKLYYLHNFGHDGPVNFRGLGINAKMSELQAAMGLAIMPHFNNILENRKKVVSIYLKQLDNSKLEFLTIRPGTEWNYHYFPVVFKNEEKLLQVKAALESQHIFPRRYFYPSLNTMSYVENTSCPISERISESILCLPLYADLASEDVFNIVKIINEVL